VRMIRASSRDKEILSSTSSMPIVEPGSVVRNRRCCGSPRSNRTTVGSATRLVLRWQVSSSTRIVVAGPRGTLRRARKTGASSFYGFEHVRNAGGDAQGVFEHADRWRRRARCLCRRCGRATPGHVDALPLQGGTESCRELFSRDTRLCEFVGRGKIVVKEALSARTRC